jgi:hypothetical protein
VTGEQQREAQRLALLYLLKQETAKADEWWKDLPTLAGRLMDSGAVTVNVVDVLMDLV